MRFALLALVLSSCSSPSKADPQPTPKPAPTLAAEFSKMFVEKLNPKATCRPWDADSVLCEMGQVIVWCSAQAGKRPTCEVAADLRPQPLQAPQDPQAPQQAAQAAAPTKPEPKKK
jgi:hypothetical protein